ncbi:MAG: tRNA (adenosine(37)-N6)-dimethylallyltransferase MiaA [Planctomycetes bacterium]|nr:tRNA (adenosine(37)-N6)-dimethylallyltransferase MiaA [Planctomycetota bacterium]
MSPQDLIVLTGPSASGKESVAFELARRISGEILSLDSMKVYREMDIGTAKPSPTHREEVRYHLIDIVTPDVHFSTGDYLQRLEAALADLAARGRPAVICGGTALYLKGFTDGFSPLPAADWELRARLIEEAREVGAEGLRRRLAEVDPEAAGKFLPGDLRRIVRALEVYEATGKPLSRSWRWRGTAKREVRLFGLEWSRDRLYERTDQRVLGMVERGLFEEARRLRDRQPPLSYSASQCIGYKEIFEGESAGWSEQETIDRIQRNTRRLVKRQMTWFRKLPLEWLPCGQNFSPVQVAEEIHGRI